VGAAGSFDSFEIADLGSLTLGQAIGTTVLIDDNAAGFGWFVDTSPSDDVEFEGKIDSEVETRIDLLTVVMHELGHILGYDDVISEYSNDLMNSTLEAGARQLDIEASKMIPLLTDDEITFYYSFNNLLKKVRRQRLF
jgi:hypothetical protein